MNAELKAKWVEALRSGRYKQGRGFLRNANDEFCCLGVLCDVVDSSKWMHPAKDKAQFWDGLRLSVPDNIGLTFSQSSYAGLNDIQMKSFNEIADFVEANE